MAAPIIIEMQENDLLHNERHGVPKCVTPHPNGKLYYVDIRAGEVIEHDPATDQRKNFPSIGADGKQEFTTAIGLNQDGSLVVARQSGIYFLKPDAAPGDEWQHVCDIPGVGDDVRPNNGAMIECHDGKTRFFLGTATKSGNALADGSKPCKLFVLEQGADGGFALKELAKDFITVNAVSGQVIDGNTHITFADSHKADSVLRGAEFMPVAGKLQKEASLIDFKSMQKEATNGRPDGTSPVLFNNRACVAIAAIDTNEIRVHALDNQELVAKITLPAGVNKPTMATFKTDADGKTQCYVSTLALPDSTDERAGKIYTQTMPQEFRAIEYTGSYAGFDALRSVNQLPGRKAVG